MIRSPSTYRACFFLQTCTGNGVLTGVPNQNPNNQRPIFCWKEFLKVAKQTDSCAMMKIVDCGVPFQNFNFFGGCIIQGTALPQSNWIESCCFSLHFMKLGGDEIIFSHQLLYHGKHHTQAPPLSAIAAPRSAASEFEHGNYVFTHTTLFGVHLHRQHPPKPQAHRDFILSIWPSYKKNGSVDNPRKKIWYKCIHKYMHSCTPRKPTRNLKLWIWKII